MTAEFPKDYSHLMVLADGRGKILAAVLDDGRSHGSKEAPKVGLAPTAGQTVHRVELPTGAERNSLLSELSKHTVKIEGDKASLIWGSSK